MREAAIAILADKTHLSLVEAEHLLNEVIGSLRGPKGGFRDICEAALVVPSQEAYFGAKAVLEHLESGRCPRLFTEAIKK